MYVLWWGSPFLLNDYNKLQKNQNRKKVAKSKDNER